MSIFDFSNAPVQSQDQPFSLSSPGVDMAAYMPQQPAASPLGSGWGNNQNGAGTFGAGMTDRMSNWGTGQPAGGGVKGWLSNGQNLSATFQGISALTSAYLGFQQLKHAKEGLKFQKDAFNANLTNSTQSYNTSLTDRINGRTASYDGKESDVKSYLAQHSLKKPGG